MLKKGGGSYRPNPDVTVINDELIKQAIKKYYEENKEEYKIVNLDILPFSELRVLNLSFQDIYRIQNLEGLTKLEELRLDNNKIKKIENISHLVNLKWLDLSFNAIEKIEGLDQLTKLHDLSLFSNLITQVEGLDNCTEINVLSIGNNLIDKHEKLLEYLQTFRKLEVFNVAGNPFTKKELEYDSHVIFKLRYLKYLDYSFIDEAMKAKMEAKDEFKNNMEIRKQEMRQIEEGDRLNKDKTEFNKKLREAKADTLDTVVTDIENDPDYANLRRIPGFPEEIQKFIVRYQELTDLLKKDLIEKNEEKLKTIKDYLSDLEQRISETEQETKHFIQDFQKKMKNTFRKFENADHNDEQELMELMDETEDLENRLVDLEMQFVGMEEEGIKDLAGKLDDKKNLMQTIIANTFVDLKNDVNDLKTRAGKVAQEELQKIQDKLESQPEGENQHENDDDIDYFLENKDGAMSSYGQFMENLENKVFRKDGEISDALQKFNKDFEADLKEKQYERNRRNVNNIISLSVKLKEQIRNQLDSLKEDEEEDN